MRSLKVLLHHLPPLAAAAVLAACTGSDAPVVEVAENTAAPSAIESLVTAQWLSQHLDDPDLVVLDCTVLVEADAQGRMLTVSGRDSHASGHIPTAAFADLTGELSDAQSSIDFAVPAPEQFAAVMGRLGVGDDTRVVLYDASGAAWSARVWWMLRWIGFDRAALLDGGLAAWTAAGYGLSTEMVRPTARTLSVKLRPELIADRDDVMAAIDDEGVAIIDALPEAHYRGEMSMYDRPGHITSASNIPVFSLLDEAGHFQSLDTLDALFDGARDGRAITYCGGGIAASTNAFVMTRLGFTDVAVYTASLQEWAADPANPMEVE